MLVTAMVIGLGGAILSGSAALVAGMSWLGSFVCYTLGGFVTMVTTLIICAARRDSRDDDEQQDAPR